MIGLLLGVIVAFVAFGVVTAIGGIVALGVLIPILIVPGVALLIIANITPYSCRNCHRPTIRDHDYCPSCHYGGTLEANHVFKD